MKYRTDFVTNSSSSSSVILTLVSKDKTEYIDYSFNEPGYWGFSPLHGINKSNLGYSMIIHYLVASKYRELFQMIQSDNNLHCLYEVLNLDFMGEAYVNEEHLKEQISKEKNPKFIKILRTIESLTKIDHEECKSYQQFMAHPIWSIDGYDKFKGRELISINEKLTNWDGDCETEITQSEVNLKNLHLKQNVTRDPQELYFEISDMIEGIDEDEMDISELTEELNDCGEDYELLQSLKERLEVLVQGGEFKKAKPKKEKPIKSVKKSKTVIKNDPPKLGKKWSSIDEGTMVKMYREKSPISIIAETLGRDQAGILYRLNLKSEISDALLEKELSAIGFVSKFTFGYDIPSEEIEPNEDFHSEVKISPIVKEIKKVKVVKLPKYIECLPVQTLSQKQEELLILITESKDAETLDKLQKGLEWAFSFDRNVNLLHLAIMNGCYDTARFLISNNIDLEQRTMRVLVGVSIFDSTFPPNLTAFDISRLVENNVLADEIDSIRKKPRQ